jgi:regulator of protease activity HflC (stomatin/prohibitin superfamily)
MKALLRPWPWPGFSRLAGWAAAAGVALALCRYWAEGAIVVPDGLPVMAGSVLTPGWLADRYAAMRYWLKKNRSFILVTLCLLLWTLVYLAPGIFISIKPGQTGVIYKLFDGGLSTSKQYSEGLHIILPWDDMFVYDVRYQQATHVIDVLSADGLRYDVEMTVRFRPRPDMIGLLHKNVGPQYLDKLLFPVLASRVRSEIAKYRAEEVYTGSREAIEIAVRDWLRQPASLAIDGKTYLDVVDIHIRSIALPKAVAQAVEAKLIQQQEMLEYTYRIEKEEKEKKRKEIEAEGVKQYNTIIRDSLNDDLIKWLGVKSTFELAKSNNSKIVIINSAKGEYPIIFGEERGSSENNRPK